MSLNQTAWLLKHKLITESIEKTGDFDLEQINQQVYQTLNIQSYNLPEQTKNTNKVVEALKRVI